MKKFLKIAFVAAFAAIAGYGVYASHKSDTMSDLALANIEALARYELPEVEIVCDNNGGACWAISGDCYVSWVLRYDDCTFSGYMSDSCWSPCMI